MVLLYLISRIFLLVLLALLGGGGGGAAIAFASNFPFRVFNIK